MTQDGDARSDLWGLEWDFLAVDSAGHVAVLSSAGYGPIPELVLAAREVVGRADDAIEALPTFTQAVRDNPEREGNFSDWYSLSERGLFAYDWNLWHGPYKRIASPAEPLNISSLPEQVQAAARLLQIPYLFAGATELHLAHELTDIGDRSAERESSERDEARPASESGRPWWLRIPRAVRGLRS
ncbi:hypothetical protein [Kribbella sp. CA-294648]|uniref:hypothetical protein n=1 Tax=Kribbella sp. CA-294648 TaxID=3239948 RepID=UPI003D94E199